MVSEDKLIRQGIRYTDKLFKLINKRVTRDLEQSATLEEFLERTSSYTTENVLITTGYQETMTTLIAQAVNNNRLMRARQRELVRTTIQETVGHLITNVGEDIKQKVRDIAKQGYDEGLHSKEIAKNITREIDIINRTRARTIARTEVARTQNIANYITAKERGASGYTVSCRPDCCEYCAEVYAEITGDDYTTLQEEVENGENDGHLIGGEKKFPMTDTDNLPPFHPNCRCSANFVYSNADDIRSQIHVRRG